MSLRYKLADWISGGELTCLKNSNDLWGGIQRDDEACICALQKQVDHLQRGLLNIINSTNVIKQGTAQKVNRQAKYILAHMPRGD